MENATVDLRRLRYFIAVCEHGGFSRASHSIGIAQPSLTRQIKLLEKEVGLPLILRTGRGAEPTKEGRYLLDRSRAHLDGLDDAVRELRHRSSTLTGEVALGICPTIASFFLSDIRAYLAQSHPKVSLNVVEAYSGDLMSLMRRGQLDLSLTYKPSAPNGLDVLELFSERLVLVTRFTAQSAGRARSLEEISRHKLILPSEIHELRRIIDAVYQARGLQLRPDLELDSLNAVKAVIAEKDARYSTILPYHSVSREVAERRLSGFAIDDEAMKRTIAVVKPHGASRRSELETVLIEQVRRVASRISRTDLHA